jgi:hypothetical protein
MAVFSHKGRSIPYQIEFAAIPKDLLLLQSSRFRADFWRPVIEDLTDGKRMAQGPGRIITCDWADAKVSVDSAAEDLESLLRTLLVENPCVVACGDGVEMVGQLASRQRFDHTLFYAQIVPPTGTLVAAIRDLLGI